MESKILIADDESDIVSMLGSFFESKGFRVLPAFNGAEALKQVEKQPDIILLDINMPGTDGLEVCKRIRDHISCPILFLTARIEDTDKVKGFTVGGDDYIVKPFSLVELEARVRAHLRREARHNFEAQVKFSGDLTIDYSERCLFFGDKRIGLAKKEFDILMAVNSLLVIIILTARFAKNLRTQLTPLFEATAEVSKQNLDFEVGHAKIKEFEDVLASFSDMKDNLKISLERQWKTEQTQKEQIAALAHDLKTPLTVIQGNADLLTETNLDDEQRLYAGYVVESSGQMQSYIQTLIDISRAAVGYQLHIESIDLPAFMQHLFGYMESLCRTKEIRLQMNTVSLPQMLKFDRVLIERAIMNVISNGLDYSPQGGTLYVDVQSNNGFVEISVTDEGTGFSKEALCHAQERFYMGDQSRNSKLHFGMGLYITNSIMEQHNGQLVLENSKETGGAKVTMKLPC